MDFAAESDQKYPSAPLVFTASNLCGRPSNNLLFDAPTPAAVGILGEAAEEVVGLSIPASPREDGEAWLEAGPLPGPAPERYADKGQGLSLAQRLLQLDFSDDEEDDGDDGFHTSRHELPEVQADPDVADAEAAEASPIIVEDCQEFIQELDSDDD
ncbi:unnamed protein product [Symbiodinium necroappetens]|uniref:Uncharacterized protein n=1 Tax=Symbiodinium necroappetens TaxID=1628268 RepID=A0A812TR62_9DINO|nr:unnamed protein product [Symbiodinium necroappetens]